MNKLIEASGGKKFSYKANPKQAFACMNNIEQFNKACQEYGVPTTATFQVQAHWVFCSGWYARFLFYEKEKKIKWWG